MLCLRRQDYKVDPGGAQPYATISMYADLVESKDLGLIRADITPNLTKKVMVIFSCHSWAHVKILKNCSSWGKHVVLYYYMSWQWKDGLASRTTAFVSGSNRSAYCWCEVSWVFPTDSISSPRSLRKEYVVRQRRQPWMYVSRTA